MNPIHKTTASLGILLTVLLAGPAAFGQTTISYANPAVVNSTAIHSTAGSAALTGVTGTWAVGDVINFYGTSSSSNPFNTASTTYYVVSTSPFEVATTPGGTPLNAVNTTTASTAYQGQDWRTGANWTGGIAPNGNNYIASLSGTVGSIPAYVIGNGNTTNYGFTFDSTSSTDPNLVSGANGTALVPWTFATFDGTTPKMTLTSSQNRVIFLGNTAANAGLLAFGGNQGLIFISSPPGAITGSGTAATSAASGKDIRIRNVNWSSFSGGVTVERGQLNINTGSATLPPQTLTVGDATTIANQILAGITLSAPITVDALNGNNLGRIWGANTVTVGTANGSGNYGGVIGKDFTGASYATQFIKTGTGTETISGIIAGTGAVTVNGTGGTLILTGTNTYSGATTVTAGKLVVSPVQTGTGAFSVASGAILDVTAVGSSQLAPTSLTMASTATTLEFINLTNTVTAPLKPGTLTLNGTVTVNINSAVTPGNNYPLVTWTTIGGPGGFVLGNCPFAATLSTNGSTLQLNVSAATTTVWTGGNNGNWDTTTTGNWTGGTGLYADGGVAVFNDTATGATNVTVNQALVKPGLASFNNSSLSYSVTSTSGDYIGGSGSVAVSGGGMVTLTGPNTYSGGTTLTAGQLNINYGGSSSANSSIGTGALTINGGALDNTSAGNVTLTPAIAQNWNGSFAYVGSVNNLNLGSGGVTLGANCQVAVNNNTLTVGGAIGDGGLGYALTNAGSGTLVLGGANTFSGGAVLSAGTIQAGSSTALGTGPSQLGAGVLDLNGNSLANSNNINSSAFGLTNSSASAASLTGNTHVNNNFTIGVGTGSISVARLIATGAPLTVTKVGAGTLNFNGVGYNNLMGVIVNGGTALFANTTATTADRGVTLNSGTIKLNAVGGGSGNNAQLINTTQPFTVNGGTFDVNGWNETVSTIGGTNGVILNSAAGTTNTLTIGPDNPTGPVFFTNNYSGNIQNGSGVLALTKVGSGTQTLSGTNTYTGGTIVTNAGTLQAGNNNVFSTAGGDMTVASGTLDLNGFTNAINGLNGAGTVDNVTNTSPATLTMGYNGDGGVFSGTIQNTAGTLSLIKVGTGIQVLSGTSSYGGSMTISNGTLVFGGSFSGSGAVTVNAPGVLNASNSVSITGAVSLAGTNATLSLLDGQMNTLTLSGGLTLTSSNILKFDITSGGIDSISITGGTFTQSGKAVINVNAVTTPNAGTYTLISGASGISAGNFILGNTLSGYTLTLSSDPSDLYLTVTVTAPATAYWHNHVSTVWNGNSGSTYNWDTDQASGINAGTVPGSPSAVYFAANGASSFNTTLGANFTIASLEFDVANNVTIGGANTLTLNGPLTVGSSAGSDTISAGSLVLGVDQNVTVANAADTLTISSPISGAHALTVSGPGTVALSGSSSYTGNTTISGGTLALNNPTNTLPDSGAVNVNGGTLSIGNNNDTVGAVTLTSGSITGSSGVLTGSSYNLISGTATASLGGTAEMTVNGSVFVGGNSTYSGGTIINSGTLQLGSGNALGTGSVTNSVYTLDLNGQTIPNLIQYTGAGILANYGTSPAAVTLDASVANVKSSFTVDTTGGNITLGRLWAANAPATGYLITVTGGHTLTFNGNGYNNLIGMEVQHATVVLANTGGYSLDRGMQMDYSDSKVILGGPGNGTAPNADLINNSGNPFYIYGGTFDINGWNETVSTVFGTSPGVILNNNSTNGTLSIGGDNNSVAGANSYSGAMQDGTGVLAITKVGTGVQILSGTCTYSGNTTIAAGQLQISASAGSPNSTYVVNTNGGLLFQTDMAFLIGGLSGSGNVALANDSSSAIGLTVGANNASTTYSGVLSEVGAGSTLTKVGTGTLTLSGTNTYSGLTTVSNGVLIISPNYVAGYNFTVNAGAALGISANTPTTSAQIGTLANGISGSGSSTLLFTSLLVPTNAPLTVNTLAPVGGAGSVIISNTAALALGTYNLINYTSLTGVGFSAFTLGTLPPGTAAHLVNNTAVTPKVIQLVVTAVSPQVWSGAVNTNWDINTTANWKLNGVVTNYYDLSPVLFNDTVGSGQTTVSLVTNVQPSSVNVSNNTKNYTFTTSTGSSINGSATFTKNGTGTLTLINLTNNFAGGATINAGTVLLSSSTLGSSGITDNSSLVFSNGTPIVSNTIAGTGTLVQAGTNTLELAGLNTYSSGTIINNGIVQSDNPSALGTGTVTLGDGVSANNATLQASPGSSFTNANPILVAAGGSGTYAIQNINNLDYVLSGNITLSNALTLATTAGGALFVEGVITSSGANPTISINGGGTTTKQIYLYGNNSSTFTGNIIITNAGGFKSANPNSLSAANTVSLDSSAFFDNGSQNLTIAGLNNYGGGGGTVAAAGGSGVSLTLGGSGSYLFGGVINNSGGIVKAGSGQQTLSGVNLYTGPTVVNSGTLLVNGSLAAGSTVTVNGGRLGGNGTINGATTVNAGAVLAAGNNGIGTLTFGNNLTLNAAATNSFNVTTAGGVSNQVAVVGILTPNSSVIRVTSGSALGTGTYPLFTYGSSTGTAFNASPVFDVAPAGTASIVDTGAGRINLVVGSSVNLTPTNITTRVSGNVLTLSWPADHTGWRLLMQTNNLNKGISGNTNDWGTVAGSAATNSVGITTTNLNDYYSMVYP